MNWTAFWDAAWQFTLVTGLSFVALCLVASMIRFYQLSSPTALLATTATISETLRFQAYLAARLGTAYRLPDPFCLLIATGPAVAAAIREQTLKIIRNTVRQADVVLALDDGTIGILLDTSRRHVEPIIARIQNALTAAGGLRVGVVSCPENGVRVQPLMAAAQAAIPAAGTDWALATPLTGAEPLPPVEDEDAAGDHGAWVDQLTGVLRPDRLRRVMPKFVARYRREGEPVSLIYLDVDYLERYNDHYGRAAGDEILRGLGLLLQHQVREDDLIGRVSEDDFVILLNCPPAAALLTANRLGGAIKKATFAAAGYTLKVTISGGVASCPEHGRTATQIFDAAHAALRAAQDRGRNMCLLFDDTMKPYHTASLGADPF
ncbi:MAG: GGDEF domain-containing protein [Verrucomicrobia bacterium]|nr:MAG: GGDEF domain-containing protein [Verrucomicrobiota bacterium]